VAIIASGIGIIFTGDAQARLITKLEPSKIAAAEGLCITQNGNPTDLASQGNTASSNKGTAFTIAGWGNCDVNNAKGGTFVHIGQIPDLLSILATHSSHGNVLGANDVAKDFQTALTQAAQSGNYPSASTAKATADSYIPPVTTTFWSFRLMMGFGVFSALLAICMIVALRGKRLSGSKGLKFVALLALPMPFLGAAFGWIFTEIGRQPWIVYPDPTNPASSLYLMTRDAVSPTVDSASIWITLIGFTLVYLIMAVFWFKLMIRYAKHGIDTDEKTPDEIDDNDESKQLSFAY
jgi:cytochrome d ubiquinol oxidase subunit I